MYVPPQSSKAAAVEQPSLTDFAGNGKLLAELKSFLGRPPGVEANMLFTGQPGLGKTDLASAYLRERFQNPLFMNGDLEEQRSMGRARDVNLIRQYQTLIPGMILGFMAIHGATDQPSTIQDKLDCVVHNFTDVRHWYLLLDEAGELYFRGLEETFRPILTDPKITVLATAQNFHTKRKTDSRQESDERLLAFMRRFTYQRELQLLAESEMLALLVSRMKKWEIKLDKQGTLLLLAQKANGNPGIALRSLHKAVDAPRRTLTWEIVEEDDLALQIG